ncbi:hypothetical protein LAZ67_5002076 [Cordylochernes scorpioides]|uniref:LIM zinc-binding domain-containing protein n=1 Tax=Cordylochernes scorpioides TaxID=51811 RepID=A0ABY6KH65_9ARAC|nr:hypothetical protein LAZ67_5002076 [Cordylochernes scorpioides]
MFSEGREDVNDEERAGRPSTSTTDEIINEVEKMILANRRITVREVAEDPKNISIGSCHSIFINDLGMRRVAAKFVPNLLNCDQKQHRMNIANEMLDSVRDDPNLLQRVITGDEAGVVHHEFLPQGRTECYKCHGALPAGEVGVVAPRLGEADAAWHPACFTCTTCEELLVDLTYCAKDGALYCERHYAEQLKPRCAACDEVRGIQNALEKPDWESTTPRGTTVMRIAFRREPTEQFRSLFSPLQFPTKATSLVRLVLAEQPLVMELPLVAPASCELRTDATTVYQGGGSRIVLDRYAVTVEAASWLREVGSGRVAVWTDRESSYICGEEKTWRLASWRVDDPVKRCQESLTSERPTRRCSPGWTCCVERDKSDIQGTAGLWPVDGHLSDEGERCCRTSSGGPATGRWSCRRYRQADPTPSALGDAGRFRFDSKEKAQDTDRWLTAVGVTAECPEAGQDELVFRLFSVDLSVESGQWNECFGRQQISLQVEVNQDEHRQ